jgi:acetoin utilization protein AcuB
MRVRELMNRNLVTIAESSSCRDAVARMHRAQVRHLPVLNGDGTLAGVITDRDLRHHLFSPPVYRAIGASPIDTLLQAARVGDIMSAPAVTVESSQDVAEAAGVMLRDKIGSLPVVEGGRLVGIITETDLLREICRADQACSPEVTDVVVSYP